MNFLGKDSWDFDIEITGCFYLTFFKVFFSFKPRVSRINLHMYTHLLYLVIGSSLGEKSFMLVFCVGFKNLYVSFFFFGGAESEEPEEVEESGECGEGTGGRVCH